MGILSRHSGLFAPQEKTFNTHVSKLVHTLRFWNDLHQVRFWNDLHQVRFWNDLDQVLSKSKIFEWQIIKSLWEENNQMA